VQHGERDSKIAHHCALVSGPAGADAGPEIAARPPVRTQNIVEEKRRNIGETGSEERGDIADASMLSTLSWKMNFIAGLGKNASLIASPDVSGGAPKISKPRA
jgi:hypothetical protein